MTRRTFMTAAAGLMALLPGWHQGKVGLMTVERWFAENRHHQSVLLNGRDITDGCVWFNDRTSQAECLKRNSQGNVYVKDGEFARETLIGRIEVRG